MADPGLRACEIVKQGIDVYWCHEFGEDDYEAALLVGEYLIFYFSSLMIHCTCEQPPCATLYPSEIPSQDTLF